MPRAALRFRDLVACSLKRVVNRRNQVSQHLLRLRVLPAPRIARQPYIAVGNECCGELYSLLKKSFGMHSSPLFIRPQFTTNHHT